MRTLNIPLFCRRFRKDFPKLLQFASWPVAMNNPQWLELPISWTNFHGSNDVLLVEVLYIKIAPDKRGIHITVFLFLYKIICHGYSLEVPQYGTFNEYLQLFSWRNKNNKNIILKYKTENNTHVHHSVEVDKCFCICCSLWFVRFMNLALLSFYFCQEQLWKYFSGYPDRFSFSFFLERQLKYVTSCLFTCTPVTWKGNELLPRVDMGKNSFDRVVSHENVWVPLAHCRLNRHPPPPPPPPHATYMKSPISILGTSGWT